MNVKPFSIPLAKPLETAHGEITERSGVIVALDPDTDDVPTKGIGEASPLPGWTESRSECREALAAVSLAGDGSEGNRTEDTQIADTQTEDNQTEGNGTKDDDLRSKHDDHLRDTPAARHAVSLAVRDAAARDKGVPLAAALATEAGFPAPAENVPVNATVGDGTPAVTAEAANEAVRSGYPAVKVKVGARPLEQDVERVRSVREAVGAGVEIRADANGAWDRQSARRAFAELATFDVAYVEQPLAAEDIEGHAMLRTEYSSDDDVDVALDESLAEVDVKTVLAAGAADVIVLKPMALGGPDRALDAASRARSAGVEPVVTTTIDAVVARTAAVHVAAAIPNVRPCGLATGSLLANDLARDPAAVENGAIAVPQQPGNAGDEFDDLVTQ